MSDSYNDIRSRYRFKNDTLVEESPIYQGAHSATMDRSDFREYLETFSTYLNRLGRFDTSSDSMCTFCDFELDLDRGCYVVNDHVEKFVSTTQNHQEIWQDGLILTYNPNGWHLINELIIPRTHTNMIDHLLDDTKQIFSLSYARWKRHSTAIKSEYADSDIDYYHAAVVNLGAGQSVWHAHTHCYTSDFNRAEYRNDEIPLVDVKTEHSQVEISVVPLDHPRLVYTMNIESVENSDQVSHSIHRLFKIGIEVMESLFDMIPPMSIGWFCSQDFSDLQMIIHPMQRTGTAQVFHKPLLHKFSTQTVSVEVQETLIKHLITLYPKENISRRQV